MLGIDGEELKMDGNFERDVDPNFLAIRGLKASLGESADCPTFSPIGFICTLIVQKATIVTIVAREGTVLPAVPPFKDCSTWIGRREHPCPAVPSGFAHLFSSILAKRRLGMEM